MKVFLFHVLYFEFGHQQLTVQNSLTILFGFIMANSVFGLNDLFGLLLLSGTRVYFEGLLSVAISAISAISAVSMTAIPSAIGPTSIAMVTMLLARTK